MIFDEDDYLAHYGTPRHSGRYPWGSGGNDSGQLPRSMTFLDHVTNLRKQGLSEVEIARGMGILNEKGEPSTTRLRALKTIANNERKQVQITQAERLRAAGMSNVAIGKEMGGLNESSVRALLAPGARDKADSFTATANRLKDRVNEVTYLDIGSGQENHIGVSTNHLLTSVQMLKEQGYQVHLLNVPQQGTGLDTRFKVLVPPGVTQRDVFLNKSQIQQFNDMTDDGGRTFYGILPPVNIHPDRVGVVYGAEGGKADGVIYVREGVPDVSLGKARYAQVRIGVGDSHHLKGMAMYNDNMPSGKDLVFNTVKNDTGNKLDAFKENTVDVDNPFGAIIKRQIGEKDENGRLIKVTSAMNIVNEEGDWLKWSKSIASQVLSKQSPALARTQLAKTFDDRKKEFDDIVKLTNPTVRKKLLEDFADSTDSASVHLKAAALDRQGWHAILPISSMPPTQIYAPNFNDGERVVLIRYPHGGTFEIPELTVNNNHPEGKRLLGDNPRDAVGIHPQVADRLSGADFDGDTVLVIPNDSNKIKTTPALDGLKDFDYRAIYKKYDGMHVMTTREKGREMGDISNLITDMTLQKPSTSDIARAIKHSMVVIDAEKHELNYKQSALDNNIRQLKAKYQGGPRAGAATLISRARSKTYVNDRKPRLTTLGGPIDPVTGQKVFQPTNRRNYRTGDPKQKKTTKLAEVTDAHILSSGTQMERLYADHSNRLKDMANRARLELLKTPSLKYSPSAKKIYAIERASLDAKLALAIRNRPLERQAQIISGTTIKIKRDARPDMDEETLKKVKFQALEEARTRTGAKKNEIVITPTEWEAIQAGAISNHRLEQILDKADMDVVRELATPKPKLLMTPAVTRRAQGMLDAGYTRAEVARQLGVSLTTLDTTTAVGNDG